MKVDRMWVEKDLGFDPITKPLRSVYEAPHGFHGRPWQTE